MYIHIESTVYTESDILFYTESDIYIYIYYVVRFASFINIHSMAYLICYHSLGDIGFVNN